MEYLNTLSSLHARLLKSLFVVVLFGLQVVQSSAQDKGDIVVFEVENIMQKRGEIIAMTDNDIFLVMEGSKDTITVDKKKITNLTIANDRVVYKEGKYHKTKGWTYAFSYAFGVNDIVSVNRQQSFQAYKLKTSSLGVGGGIALKYHPGKGVRRFHKWDYKFCDLFAYGKYFLNDKRRRLFVDSKLGYSIALDKEEYKNTSSVIISTINYKSGLMIQPGVGLQFSGARDLKWGIKVDGYLQETRQWVNEAPVSGVERKFLYGAMFGINFYL